MLDTYVYKIDSNLLETLYTQWIRVSDSHLASEPAQTTATPPVVCHKAY